MDVRWVLLIIVIEAWAEETPEANPATTKFQEAEELFSKNRYHDALALYRQAVDLGSNDAKVKLALHYIRGQPYGRDLARGAQLIREAAETGHPSGLRYLGTLYFKGIGLQTNITEAIVWYEKAAAVKDAEAMASLGIIYDRGYGGIARSDEKALEYFRSAAESSTDPSLQHYAAVMFEKLGDYETAFRWHNLTASKGNHGGEAGMGYMYEKGYVVKLDYKIAAEYYGKAARHGEARALTRLGFLAYSGLGVPQSYEEAFNYLMRAVRTDGTGQAAGLLGFLFATGRGTHRDEYTALHWTRVGAEKGFVDAQVNMGLISQQAMFEQEYELESTNPNPDAHYRKAIQFFKAASEQNSSIAQIELASMYQNGMGVTRDLEESRALLQKAISNTRQQILKLKESHTPCDDVDDEISTCEGDQSNVFLSPMETLLSEATTALAAIQE